MPKHSTDFNAIGAMLGKASEQKKEIPNVQPSPSRTGILGRKKRLSTKRENAITVYCTDEMMSMLEEIKYNNRVERQRVIQTALYEFLAAHYSKDISALTSDGFKKVQSFEKTIEI